MLKIGDFSKLTRVSIRMLRHYDELGLLRPAHIDTWTGYRYYTAEQMARLNRILALQDLGFSLEQIGVMLDEQYSLDDLRSMYRMKQAELQDKVQAELARLARVEARLKQIESEDMPLPYDIVVKQVGPQWVAGARGKISQYHNIGYLFEQVFAHVAKHNVGGLPAAVWHDDSYREDEIDAEALVLLPAPVTESAIVKVYQLPQTTLAALVYQGAFNRIGAAYDTLVRWIDVSGNQIAGPNRELYLHFTQPMRPDDESYVTEIQFPISQV